MGLKDKLKSGASSAYGFVQRIEYAPEDKVQKGERLFGLRDTVTAKPPKRKVSKKPVKKTKKIQPKRKPSRPPKIGKATKIKPTTSNNGSYVKVGKRNPTVKKYPVSYKRGGNRKYNREWFADKKEAEKFAKAISKELKTKVTYE